nr:hypothetical protein [Tanacetum cinerariifolium]
MTSLFAESHNMVAILEKSDASEGFEQIIDFLSGSYINHALTVNPHVYISCIKQFWNTAVVKHSGDVTRLQALVDKKSIVITEEVVHEILQLNDAEGGDDVQEHAAEEVATDTVPPTPTSPSPSSLVISSLPPHQPPCPPQPQDAEGSSLLFQRVLATCSALALRVEGLENDKATQQLEIVKLKARVKKLEKISKVKTSKLRRLKNAGTSQRVESSDDVENVFNQGRIIVDMDQDEGIELETDQEKDAEVAAASTPIPAAKPKTLTITVAPDVSTRIRGVVIRDPKEELPFDTPAETPKVKDKGKGILIEALKPLKKKDQIEMDAEEDLETLWKIVRDKFSTSKPINFLDEYLLLTLKTMFEEPDGQDAI